MSQPSDPSHSDPFAPPKTPCEVQCVHCGESYESWRIEWREAVDDAIAGGSWCCPTAGCDGIGFGFDIFPVDPKWTDERGEPMMAFFNDDEEAEDDDEVDFDDDDENESATIGLGTDDDGAEDDDDHDGLPIDAFDADAFWLDVDALLPPPLGNTPQAPFDEMMPMKKPWSSQGHDDMPF